MDVYGISKAELKKHNRVNILKAIWEYGPISRVDIARILQITRSAITILSSEMINQNIIHELSDDFDGKTREGHKGRRKVMLEINFSRFFLLGTCIDADNISIGLTTLDGKVLEKSNLSLDGRYTADELAGIVKENADKFLEHCRLDMSMITGLGIAVMPSAPAIQGMCTPEGVHDYSLAENAFSKRFGIPVFADNGIKLLSLASFGGVNNERIIANRVLLYAEKDGFCMSVVRGNQLRSDNMDVSSTINAMCVRPDGEALDGLCKGAARSELTASAIGRKTAQLYCEEGTPELYRLTGGECGAVTMGQLLAAYSSGDEAIGALRREVLDSFCLMLNNIIVMYGADRIILSGFDLSQSQLDELHGHAEAFGGIDFAAKISLCHIDRQHSFTSGCVNAALKGFFKTGGIIRPSEE